MSRKIEALAQGASELPPDQRLALAQLLLASVEPQGHPGIDAAWATEIRERIRRYDAGETQGIAASEVFAEIDRQLSR